MFQIQSERIIPHYTLNGYIILCTHTWLKFITSYIIRLTSFDGNMYKIWPTGRIVKCQYFITKNQNINYHGRLYKLMIIDKNVSSTFVKDIIT